MLFCAIREEISDGLYDDPHRIHRFVHVWADMASIPREKMRCLASLRRVHRSGNGKATAAGLPSIRRTFAG